MIQFLKLDTANNTATYFDGSKPYIHWSDPISTSFYSYMRINWKSDSPKHSIFVEEGGPFGLLGASKADNWKDSTGFDWDANLNIGRLTTLMGTPIKTGDDVEEYWYDLLIILKSDVAGEYVGGLYIDGEEFMIGAHFYDLDVPLKINLANQGLEISDLIYKALYQGDLRNESPDFVLLNRKFKELLVNFLDIHCNKGSYKSLVNSLNWFDFGNLVELRDIWKYQTPDGTKYYDRSLVDYLTEEVKKRAFNSSKTTSFYLRHLIKRHSRWPELTETEYEREEDILGRQFDGLSTKWSLDEMRLKMVLLGGFLQQHFMSIHNELIMSVCEDLFVTDDIVIESGAHRGHFESFDVDIAGISSEWDSDQNDTPDYDAEGDINGGTGMVDTIYLKLGQIHTTSDPDTLFCNKEIKTTHKGLEYIPIVGVRPEGDESDNPKDDDDWLSIFAGQNFYGIGAIANAHFSFPSEIESCELTTNAYGSDIKIKEDFESSEYPTDLRFSILFIRPGDFILTFAATDTKGKIYSKIVKVNVKNNLTASLDFYKLVARAEPGSELPDPWTSDEVSSRYMFDRSHSNYEVTKKGNDYSVSMIGEYKYTQVIPLSSDFEPNYPDAPFRTKVLNMSWKSDFNYHLDEVKKKYGEEFYIRSAKTGKNSGWVQIVSKYRGSGIPWFRELIRTDSNNPEDIEYFGKYWYSEIFIPEYHKLEPIESDLPQCYPLVCVPSIKLGDNSEKLSYSYLVDTQLNNGLVWEFFSVTKNEVVKGLEFNIEEPMMLWEYSTKMPTGIYKVKFGYNWNTDKIEENIVEKYTDFKIISDQTL